MTKESESISRLQTALEVEIRDLEGFIEPYRKLIQEKRRQHQVLENERLEAQKQEFMSENEIRKSKKKEKPSQGDSDSSKSEQHLMNKFMSALSQMSPEAQDELLKRYNLK